MVVFLTWLQAIIIMALLLFGTKYVFYIFTWFFTDPPSIPTNRNARKVMMHHIITYKSNPKMIYDLGSGYGQLAFAAAKKFPEAQIIGYEIFWLPYFIAYLKKCLFGYKNVTFKKCNFFQEDLSNADVVLCFLLPKYTPILEEKLKQELHDGTLVISNQFKFPTWQPKKIKELPCIIGKRMIFTYQKK